MSAINVTFCVVPSIGSTIYKGVYSEEDLTITTTEVVKLTKGWEISIVNTDVKIESFIGVMEISNLSKNFNGETFILLK